MVNIDLKKVKQIRKVLPLLKNRRTRCLFYFEGLVFSTFTIKVSTLFSPFLFS